GGDGGRSSLAAVIAAAVAWLRERGATTVEALVDDAEDQLLLEAYRDQHFEHDRSDLTFRVG
ncbi:MAG: hypothetical protein L0I76_06465, partial [Pseudonocardia sp.]|nr:hypothetical protein [Pseudonocardia sp.]